MRLAGFAAILKAVRGTRARTSSFLSEVFLMSTLDFGGKIKTLRLSKSMTQEQLAQRLRVSPQAVSKWENGVSHS